MSFQIRYAEILFFLFFISSVAWSQNNPVAIRDLKAESQKIDSGIYEITFTGDVNGEWQVYAPNQLLDDFQTTELKFADTGITIQGPIIPEGTPQSVSSSIFNRNIKVYQKSITWKARIKISGQVPEKLPGELYYTFGKDDEFYPATLLPFVTSLEGGVKAAGIKIPSIRINEPESDCGDEGTKNKSLLAIFSLGVLGGLIALLTPCVFPMIPVTVTFFTKKSVDKKRGITNAVLYGFFIFLIYVLITLPFHIAGKAISPEIFNNISTNVWLNIIFFAIFVFFAFSFFGFYEIGLPAGLANKMDSKSGLGNVGGIFFMAATLAIVSFSCTGPILGTLLVGVAEQGAWPLSVGAAGFGLALGLPFALFAMFPHWLNSLPKSGGWMTDVKVVLGFLELALAVKFLSNADLVKQWGLLKREVFIGLWILISFLIFLYLAGKLKFSHSTPVKKYSFSRIAFIVLFLAITIYLLPGLSNSNAANLKLISGFPPPRTYSLYPVQKNQAGVFVPIHNDYQKALAMAKEQHKPVLIDFTGWACVNCRKMEEKIWPDKVVDSLMRNEFIVVSLYVDERKNLPLAEQTVAKLANGSEKSIITVGDKWATFQTENFDATAQPQYAIISPDQKAMTKTKFFTESATDFSDWLLCGLTTFRNLKK